MEPIRREDWIAELERQLDNAKSPDGMSSEEIAEALGIGRRKCGEELRKLNRQGILIHTGFRMGHGIDGRIIKTPLYKLRKEGA